MAPDIECVTLWRDREYLDKFKGRLDLIDYAESMNIPVGATKEFSYSEDENMFHISYESGELEDPAYPGHAVEYPGLVLKKKSVGLLDTPDVPARLTIDFKEGTPSRVFNVDTEEEYTDSLSMFHYLNEIGGQHGVGRIDIVENRFVGMKSRGCYETPGGTILHAAHLDLECLTMDREVMRIRDGLSLKYTELVYNGYGVFFVCEKGVLGWRGLADTVCCCCCLYVFFWSTQVLVQSRNGFFEQRHGPRATPCDRQY
jgi:argininosuccinate synthase